MATQEEIQRQVEQHELQIKKINEAAVQITNKAKGAQSLLAQAQQKLHQLNDMKIARLGALAALKDLGGVLALPVVEEVVPVVTEPEKTGE
jgi:hypothetical protein